MSETGLTLEDLHAAYRHWAGEPMLVSDFRHTPAPPTGVPAALDVLCFQASAEDKLASEDEYTILATVGISTHATDASTGRLELVWEISRRLSMREARAAAEALAEVAVLPFYRQVRFVPGVVVRGVQLPLFERMTCLLITNWGVYGDEQLPGLEPPVKLLWVKALFESEADIAEQIGEFETNRQLHEQGIDWDDPARAMADLRLVDKTDDEETAMTTQDETPPQDMQQIWRDIENWYQQHAPELYKRLKPGATDDEIAAAETQLGRTLPDDYKASLRVHNGNVSLHDYTYLDIAQAVGNWSRMKNLADKGTFADREADDDAGGAIQKAWWHDGYIPFAEDGGGNMICIDLAPGAQGQAGQIVQMEMGAGPFLGEHNSFGAWLKDYRDRLLAGKYKVEDGFLVEI